MKLKKGEFLKSLLNRLSYDEEDEAEVQNEATDQTTKLLEAITNYTMSPETVESSTPTPVIHKYEMVKSHATTPTYEISDYPNEIEITTILEDVYNSVPSIGSNATNGTTLQDRIIAETIPTVKLPLAERNVHFEEMKFSNNSFGSTLIDKRRFKWWKVHERIHDYKHKLQTIKLQWWAFLLMFMIVMFVLFLMSFVLKKFNEYRLQEQLEAIDRKAKNYTVQVQNTIETESELPKKCMGNQPITQTKNDQTGISFVFSKDDNKKADGVERKYTTDPVTPKVDSDATTIKCFHQTQAVNTRKYNAEQGNILDPLNIEKTTVIKYGAVEINYNVRRQETKFQNMSNVTPTDVDMESSTDSEESHTHMEKHLVPKKEHHALNVPGSTDAGPHNTHPTPRHDKSEEHVENEVSNVRFVEYTHIQNKIHGNMTKLVIRDDSDNTVHFDDRAITELEADIDKPSSSTTTRTADNIKQAQSLKSLLSERCDSSLSQHMHNENRIMDDHFKTFMENIDEAGKNAKIQVKDYIDKIELIDSDLHPEKAPEHMDLDNVKNKQGEAVTDEEKIINTHNDEPPVVTENQDISQTEQPEKNEVVQGVVNKE